MKLKKFNSDVIQSLKYYVYLLSDPDTGEIFYVGKGRGNRVFQHFSDKEDNPKTRKIRSIQAKGKEPKIEILVHGIEDDFTIKKIEAAIIDLLDKSNLSNRVLGYESTEFGRMDLNQIQAKYGSSKANITEKALLIKLSDTFRYNMSDAELYDYTRGIWIVSEKRRILTEYAFAVYDGVIQETYRISGWFEAGSTFHVRDVKDSWKKNQRYEFVGVIDQEMRKKYRHKSVNHYFKMGAQNPIRYTYDLEDSKY